MKARNLVLGTALAAMVGVPAVMSSASAADELYIPLTTYRTGAYAGGGTPIADGLRDYFNMLNERDGGIGGAKLVVEECETGYKTDKGVECYEGTKGKGALVYNPYSTGITLQLIPKSPVDKIPVLSMGYGLSAGAVGKKFPWLFNFPATYWSQASVVIKYIAGEEGGLDKLKGKKIGFIHLDHPYGKEPIPLLQQLSKELGYKLVLIPVAPKEMQNQASHWLQVRKERPDWMVMWGWGAMNPTAIKEAAKIKYPMDHFIGVWWSGGNIDVVTAGAGSKGYKSANFHSPSTNFKALQDIKKLVIDAGKSISGKKTFGDNYYNRGVMNAVLVSEAIRTAQKLTGKKVINGEDMRKGLENLDLSEARLKEIGLEGFTQPVKVSCEFHDSGSHPVFIQQWDGKEWKRVSDWIEPMYAKVRPLLEAAADDYVKKQADWQTQDCK